jgi:hypothetical protein
VTNLGMMAQVFVVLTRLVSAYAAGEINREKFLRDWSAFGHAVELVAKDMDGPISLGRLSASRGGKQGGPARAASLTSAERSDQARHAANERWLGVWKPDLQASSTLEEQRPQSVLRNRGVSSRVGGEPDAATE